MVKGKTTPKADPRMPARPRNFRIGNDVLPGKRDVGRYVKWPRYIRIQRQRKILNQRLKVPPAVHQFSKTLERNASVELFKLLNKLRPETKKEKKDRLASVAGGAAATPPPPVLKFGINHVTQLVEEKKAKLVVIACDVTPLEIVVWLPTLCRRMEVPYVIVQNKARLGALVHQKTVTAVAVTDVDGADASALSKMAEVARAQYNDNADALREWGGGIMGARTQSKVARHEAALAAERAKKAALMG